MANSAPPPPYVGFGVFKGIIETLAQSTVPSGPLDRRVLDGVSGADYGAAISAMRFLGLVDDQRKATQAYRDLVAGWKKGPEHYRDELTKVIGDRYDAITAPLDMESGTAAEVEKAFRDAGVAQGQMLTKTIRFYVKALQELGVTVSPHITKAKRAPSQKKNGDRNKLKKTKDRHTPDEAIVVTSFNGKPANTMRTVTLPEAKGSLTLHGTFNVFDLVGDERDLVFAIIDKMKAFENAHPPDEAEEEE